MISHIPLDQECARKETEKGIPKEDVQAMVAFWMQCFAVVFFARFGLCSNLPRALGFYDIFEARETCSFQASSVEHHLLFLILFQRTKPLFSTEVRHDLSPKGHFFVGQQAFAITARRRTSSGCRPAMPRTSVQQGEGYVPH